MSNSKKLEEDAAKHRGFSQAISDGVHPIVMSHYGHKPRSAGQIEKEMVEMVKQSIERMQKSLLGIDDIFTGADFAGPPPEFTHHIELKRPCSHTNKRKEGIHKLFWVCNDCKKDLGDA